MFFYHWVCIACDLLAWKHPFTSADVCHFKVESCLNTWRGFWLYVLCVLHYHWKTWHWAWLSVLVIIVMLLMMLLVMVMVMVMVMIFVAVMMSSPSPSPATQPGWLHNQEKETSGRSSFRCFWRRQIDIREQRRSHIFFALMLVYGWFMLVSSLDVDSHWPT